MGAKFSPFIILVTMISLWCEERDSNGRLVQSHRLAQLTRLSSDKRGVVVSLVVGRYAGGITITNDSLVNSFVLWLRETQMLSDSVAVNG